MDIVGDFTHVRGLASKFFPDAIPETGHNSQHILTGFPHIVPLFFAHLAESRIQALHLVFLMLP